MSSKRAAKKLPSWMTTKVDAEDRPGKDVALLTFQGVINYCATVDDMARVCEELILRAHEQDELVIALDAEWPVYASGGSGKIALLQICWEESTCHLFHVSRMPYVPKIFQLLIQHPKVRLVGSCIENDLWKLSKDFNIRVAKLIQSGTVIDLGDLANKVLKCAQTWSLDRLVLHLLSFKIDKGDSVRKSRWDLELSSTQQIYAATDVFVSLLIFNKLKAEEELRNKKKLWLD